MEKTQKLTLGNAFIEDDSELHDIISGPEDPICYIKLIKYYRFDLGGDDDFGRFFRRKCGFG